MIELQCLAHRRCLVNISDLYTYLSILLSPKNKTLCSVEETFLSLVFGYNFPHSHAFHYLTFLSVL